MSLARKYCGKQNEWPIKLENLQKSQALGQIQTSFVFR